MPKYVTVVYFAFSIPCMLLDVKDHVSYFCCSSGWLLLQTLGMIRRHLIKVKVRHQKWKSLKCLYPCTFVLLSYILYLQKLCGKNNFLKSHLSFSVFNKMKNDSLLIYNIFTFLMLYFLQIWIFIWLHLCSAWRILSSISCRGLLVMTSLSFHVLDNVYFTFVFLFKVMEAFFFFFFLAF